MLESLILVIGALGPSAALLPSAMPVINWRALSLTLLLILLISLLWEATLGGDNIELATTLDNLAVVLAAQEKFDQAVPLYQRSLALREKNTVLSMNNLALALDGKGEDAAAQRVYKRALALADKNQELIDHTRKNYDELLKKIKKQSANIK